MSYETNLVNIQPLMGGYIRKSVYNPCDAIDVLQNTNAVLMSKKEDYDPDRGCFESWALGFARWQIKAYLKKLKRNREVLLSEDIDRADGKDFCSKSLEKSINSHHDQCEAGENKRQSVDASTPSNHVKTSLEGRLLFPKELLASDHESLKKDFRDCLNSKELFIFDSVCEGLSLEFIANKLNSTRNATSTAKSRLVLKLRKRFTRLKASNKYDWNNYL